MTTSTTTQPKPTLGDFWHDLPRAGKLMLSVVAFEFIGSGLVLPFIVVYLHEVRGFTLSETGLLIGLQPLAGLLALGPGGSIIDRFGPRRVVIGALLCSIGGQVCMALASHVAVAMLAMILTGISFGVSWPAFQAFVASVVPAAIRQRYFGINFSLLNLGIGVGGILGGLIVDVDRVHTFQAVYAVDAVSYLPALFLMLVPLRHVGGPAVGSTTEGTEPGSYREVLRLRGLKTLTVLTFLSVFVGYAQLNTGMPAYARAVGKVSTQGLGLAFAANTLVIVVLQLVVLQRLEGRRRTRCVAVMAGLWAIAWITMGASGLFEGTWGATLLIATCASVFALGETLLQPTVPAMVNDLATDRLRGRTNALNAAAFQLPMVLAPPVAGFLIGHDLTIQYVTLLVLGCAAVAWVAVRRLEPQLEPKANGITVP